MISIFILICYLLIFISQVIFCKVIMFNAYDDNERIKHNVFIVFTSFIFTFVPIMGIICPLLIYTDDVMCSTYYNIKSIFNKNI